MERTQGTLEGRRALVTGASRGIGRAIALAYAQAGADVGITARSEGELRTLAEEIAALGRRAVVARCDVTDVAQVGAMTDHVLGELGGVDILVNNAGMADSHKFIDHPDELWHRTIALNLNSVYYVTKAFLPGMVERRAGRVINVASIAGKVGQRYTAAYSASKHGVLGLTKTLALEMARQGITVNAICPGWVDTPMTEGGIQNIVAATGMTPEQARKTLESQSPQQRLVTPEEVAALAVFLARDEAAAINGQAINVDGGTVMW